MSLVKHNDLVRKALSYLISFIVTRMPFLIPAERLRETDTLLAFRHPRPAQLPGGYRELPTHVVLECLLVYECLS